MLLYSAYIAYFAVFSYRGICLCMYYFVDTQITRTINIQMCFSIKLNLLPLAKNDGPYRVTQWTLNDVKTTKMHKTVIPNTFTFCMASSWCEGIFFAFSPVKYKENVCVTYMNMLMNMCYTHEYDYEYVLHTRIWLWICVTYMNMLICVTHMNMITNMCYIHEYDYECVLHTWIWLWICVTYMNMIMNMCYMHEYAYEYVLHTWIWLWICVDTWIWLWICVTYMNMIMNMIQKTAVSWDEDGNKYQTCLWLKI
jgi:hypothetical protein